VLRYEHFIDELIGSPEVLTCSYHVGNLLARTYQKYNELGLDHIRETVNKFRTLKRTWEAKADTEDLDIVRLNKKFGSILLTFAVLCGYATFVFGIENLIQWDQFLARICVGCRCKID